MVRVRGVSSTARIGRHVRVEKMRDGLAADNREQLQRTAHSLKGAAANLGLRVLSEACAALDENVRHRGCDGAAPLLKAVEISFVQAEAALVQLTMG